MTTLDVTAARKSFADAVNRVSYGKERIAIQRHGKILAGMVSAEELELLEAINARDLKDAKAAIKAAKTKGQKSLPWTTAKKELDA
jgi:PHD/YefM family antitoxin component YafN of YafNO toxin-antitoxin module